MSETKQCPYCSNEILTTAKKCKHCHEWLNFECPYCAEVISSSSEQCPYCKSKLIVAQQDNSPKKNKQETTADLSECNKPFLTLQIIVWIIGIICGLKSDMGFGLFLAIFIFFYIYFLPTEIADNKRHPNTTAIFVINLFFGVTILGWVGALIWAVIKAKTVKVEIS